MQEDKTKFLALRNIRITIFESFTKGIRQQWKLRGLYKRPKLINYYLHHCDLFKPTEQEDLGPSLGLSYFLSYIL